MCEYDADIDELMNIGQTNEIETAAKECKEANQKKENAILISQPYKDMSNISWIKTKVDRRSNISILIEQYLQKKFNYNELTIPISRKFKKYYTIPNYEFIGLAFNVSDELNLEFMTY